MTTPPNIRLNAQANFPSLVTGNGPIAIAKSAGVWVISFAASLLSVQIPPFGNFNTDQVLVWDSIAKTWIMVPMTAFAAANQGRAQRSIVNSGGLPIVGLDSILNINAASDLSPVVPAANTRSGAPLTFHGVVGGHSQTLTRTGADTFDGATTLVLNAGATITLVPYNDGVNAGWAIE